MPVPVPGARCRREHPRPCPAVPRPPPADRGSCPGLPVLGGVPACGAQSPAPPGEPPVLAGWHLRKRRRASLPAPSDTDIHKYYLYYIYLHIQVCVYKRAGVDSGGRDGSVPPPRNPALRAAAGPRRPPRPRCSRAPLGAEPARGCPQPGHRHGAVPGAGAVPGPPLGFVFHRFTGARCDEAAPGGLRCPPGRGTAGGGGAGGVDEAGESQGVLRGGAGVHGCVCGAVRASGRA